MESGISVGGLASGIDTNAIIDGLTAIEENKVIREEKKRQEIEDKQEAFSDLITRIGNLSNKAEELEDKESFNLFKAESNDKDIVTLEGDEGATAGTYNVEVFSLATSHKVASDSFAAINTALSLAGTFEISASKEAIENDPTETTKEIEITATDTLKDVVNKINSTDGIGVSASILKLDDGDYRFVLTSVDEGSEPFTLKETSGNVLGTGAGELGLITDNQKMQSDFNFRLEAGGAAVGTSLLNELSTGLTANNLDASDSITINGTDAAGNAITEVAWNFDPDTNTIDDLISQVESAFGGSGNVSVSLNDSGEIVVEDLTGGTSEMSMTLAFVDDGSGSTLNLGSSNVVNDFVSVVSEGKQSFYKVDGLSVSAQGNTDDETVTGTKIHLHKADPGTIVHTSLERDMDGIKDKISGFIEEYNSLMGFIDEKSEVTVGDDDSVEEKGPFAGDSTIRRIKSEIRGLMTSQIDELSGTSNYTSLAIIGITSDKNDGSLKIDDDKLKKALNADFEGVRRLFIADGTSDNPLHEFGNFTEDTETGTYYIDPDTDSIGGATGSRFGDILSSIDGTSKGLSIDAATGSGTGTFTFTRGIASLIKKFYNDANDYVDGSFKITRESFETRLQNVDNKIIKLEDQVANYRDRLIRQFSAMEQSMARLQQQQASFAAQVG